jgi:membrane carboxypeptidase/penicillin-binding protein
MNSLLREITRTGTLRAQSTLSAPGPVGKTGTTNDAVDACGLSAHLLPRNLGGLRHATQPG